MKRLIPLLALTLFGTALAQSTYPGLTPEEAFLAATIVTFVSAFISSKLTTLVKLWGGTTGVTTATVSAVLNALIAGVGGWSVGLYAHNAHGFFAALASVVVAYLTSTGIHESQVMTARRGTEQAVGVPAPGESVVK